MFDHLHDVFLLEAMRAFLARHRVLHGQQGEWTFDVDARSNSFDVWL